MLTPCTYRLQSDSGALGIMNFGLTQTSLEEVFLNLATEETEGDDAEGGAGMCSTSRAAVALTHQFYIVNRCL